MFIIPFLIAVMLPGSSATALDWVRQSSEAGDITLANGGFQQVSCLVGDLDGDGLKDIVIGERTQAPSVVAYYQRPGGWVAEIIEFNRVDVEAGGLLNDIDGDGDLDILLGGDNAINQMWWWENPGPPPFPGGWTRRFIKNGGKTHHHDQVIGDFDGDGLKELVFWNRNDGFKLFLADFPLDPKNTEPWPFVEIFAAPTQGEGLANADINLDGKDDIVGAGYWFEHIGGTNYTAHLIEANRTFTRTIVAQFIPGGRPEVAISPGDVTQPLTLNEWDGSAWVTRVLDPVIEHGHTLEVGDVNQDGLLDLFSAEMYTPGAGDLARSRIFLNQGGGVFLPEYVTVGIGNHESRLLDMDNDGWLDIVGKPFQGQAPGLNIWYRVPPVPPGPDTLSAEVQWARATDSSSVVHLQFSEKVTAESATQMLNYSLSGGIQVTDAALGSDQRTVELTVSGMEQFFPYTVSTSGIVDLADPPNVSTVSAPVTFRHKPWPRSVVGLRALYDFEQGSGEFIHDVNPNGFPLDLTIGDTTVVAWNPGGIEILTGTTFESDDVALGVSGASASTGAVTVEAWVESADLAQGGPARIVTVSQNTGARNITLGQGFSVGDTDQFSVRMRTTTTDNNGQPTSGTGAGTMNLALSHCVVTRDASGDLRIYVNGVLEHQEARGGDFSNWDLAYKLTLGGEPDPLGRRHWLGEFRMVAVYDRALSSTEVLDHFNLGADAPLPLVSAVTPSPFRMLAVAPNPFNASCALSISTDRPENVNVEVFDLRGRRVTVLAQQAAVISERTFVWDGRDNSGRMASSGTYFFRVSTTNWTETLKAVLAK